MISLKQFHLFFIAVSILITGYYGVYEITHPSNPGTVSNILAGISFLVTISLIAYSFSVIKKFKQI
jgi:divalent metal cation (Fe/Co/Zn/Cd) transporter|tara:strand:+ start:207 stop:404 length:198 start_codon:yes stop_codon:yes gene_type:complete